VDSRPNDLDSGRPQAERFRNSGQETGHAQERLHRLCRASGGKLEETRRFYAGAFGWRFIDYGPSYVAVEDAGLDAGFQGDPEEAPAAPLVILYAEHLESMRDEVTAAGGRITDRYSLPRRAAVPLPRSRRERAGGLVRTLGSAARSASVRRNALRRRGTLGRTGGLCRRGNLAVRVPMSAEFSPSLEPSSVWPFQSRRSVRRSRAWGQAADAGHGGRERDFAILFVNAAFENLTGYARAEVVGRNPRFLQGPGTDPDARRTLRDALDEDREVGVELLNYRKDGSTFWNGMFMSPVRDGNVAAYWFGSLLDVTDRKEGELALRRVNRDLESSVAARTADLRSTVEQRTVLLHEVEHRVKNNLQLIASLLQFQARRTSDPGVREALRTVQARVSAVSTAHRRLFHTSDVGRFEVGLLLRDMVEDLLGRSRREDLRAHFELDEVQAPAADAAALGLLVGEVLGMWSIPAPTARGPDC
jgi:PAS domain S-box-containing protein